MSGTGYGGAGYGSSGYGSPAVSQPALLSALAISENVVRLTFNQPMYFSGLLDFPDASSRKRYSFTAVAGTSGLDGTSAKSIGVAAVALELVPGMFSGQVIDVTTDRPMTPSPAQYTVQCNGLFAADALTPLSTLASAASFEAVFKQLQPPQQETLSPRGDVAMPQSLEAIRAGVVPNPAGVTLGSFVVADGDYATQGGLVEYKERCYRRMISTPDSFLHMAGKNYGAGLLSYGKRLASAARRAQLQGSIEQQVGQEPETAAVACKTTPKPSSPGLMYLVLLARTNFGTSLRLMVPVNTSD
jgi:hypothetical protein